MSPQARARHQRLHVADLHDTLMWDRDPLERADRGHVDLPRLREGHVALQVFLVGVEVTEGQNYESNTGDTDNITLLTMVQPAALRTWGRCCSARSTTPRSSSRRRRTRKAP